MATTAAVFTNDGEVLILKEIGAFLSGGGSAAYLYDNDQTPECDHEAADYDINLDTPFENPDWDDPTARGDGMAVMSLDGEFTFAYAGAGVTIYGLILVDSDDGELLYALRFDSSVVLANGDTVTVSQLDIFFADPACPPGCP